MTASSNALTAVNTATAWLAIGCVAREQDGLREQPARAVEQLVRFVPGLAGDAAAAGGGQVHAMHFDRQQPGHEDMTGFMDEDHGGHRRHRPSEKRHGDFIGRDKANQTDWNADAQSNTGE